MRVKGILLAAILVTVVLVAACSPESNEVGAVPVKLADLLIQMLIELIFAFLGAFFALWYEGLRRPRLVIEMHDRAISPYTEFGTVCFPHLAVRNVPRTRCNVLGRKIDLPFVEPETAWGCEGTIRFLTIDGERLHSRDLVIRWPWNPEPVKYELNPRGEQVLLPDLSLDRVSKTMNIPSGAVAPIDIAVRLSTDPNAYGWNHESYRHKWKHPDFAIPPGRHVIEVRVQSGSQQTSAKFYLINGPKVEDFVVKPFHNLVGE